MTNVRQCQDKLAWGTITPHTEVLEEICFDLSHLIAVSIKILLRKHPESGGYKPEMLCLDRVRASPAVFKQVEGENVGLVREV